MFYLTLFSLFVLIGADEQSNRIISLASNSSQELTIYDNEDNRLGDWVRFITVGLHSQQYNITFTDDNQNKSITGQNIGLVLFVDRDQGIVVINNNNSVDINILVVVDTHGDNDPIPGGCNQEFGLEVSPFLRLYADQYVNRLEYQLANIGAPKGFKRLKCDKSQFLIKYDIYAYFLKENDFSENEYFRAITLMSNETNIKHSAIHLLNVWTTEAYFYSYPGRGIVYNIIATSQQYSSAYIPIVTYDCEQFSQCAKLNLLGIITSVILGLIGFVVCLRGHQWFQLQMVFFGFIDGSFVSYILLLKLTSLSDSQISIYTIVIGVFASVLWVSVWKIVHLPFISLLLSGLSLGLLFVATVLFTSIGNLQLFHNDINYWLIMGCTALLTTIFFLMLNAIVLSVVSTSIVGSYVAVMAVDRLIDGSVSFIVINVIKRAIYNYNAINNVPFQNRDIILSILWIILSLTGIILQLYNSTDRSPFPPPSSCSHPHRQWSRPRPFSRADPIRRGVRTRRFDPMPSAPLFHNNQHLDETTSLLYPNINHNNYNLTNNTNAYQREYQSI